MTAALPDNDLSSLADSRYAVMRLLVTLALMTVGAAGMYVVGVAWGFREILELQQHGANTIVQKPSELMQLLRG